MGNSYTYRSGDDSRGVLDAFTAGYVSAMLFGENVDTGDDSNGDSFLDAGYTWSDIAPESQLAILERCKAFREAHAEDIADYGEAEAGADLYFTSVGHGVGYWENDHGTPEICARLDKAAEGFSEPNAYLGDDGKVYVY